ncbi:hypothetical protein TRIUR3_15057 [Triticum urartu]|uniref:Bowman-Birk serine protease inhibitors family domain-containing protein n=1 Tax=Triticum urartu TaxID=4572 RepID=M7Z9K8_TRIUA|nr:hypothetical protein TRIUR3_15057 [Triticum urartu]
MKITKLVAILVLLAVLFTGILAQPSGYFPKCCDNCRSFSGIDVCDDAHPECPKGCLQCRVVQTSPTKTFRCAGYRGDSDDTEEVKEEEEGEPLPLASGGAGVPPGAIIFTNNFTAFTTNSSPLYAAV